MANSTTTKPRVECVIFAKAFNGCETFFHNTESPTVKDKYDLLDHIVRSHPVWIPVAWADEALIGLGGKKTVDELRRESKDAGRLIVKLGDSYVIQSGAIDRTPPTPAKDFQCTVFVNRTDGGKATHITSTSRDMPGTGKSIRSVQDLLDYIQHFYNQTYVPYAWHLEVPRTSGGEKGYAELVAEAKEAGQVVVKVGEKYVPLKDPTHALQPAIAAAREACYAQKPSTSFKKITIKNPGYFYDKGLAGSSHPADLAMIRRDGFSKKKVAKPITKACEEIELVGPKTYPGLILGNGPSSHQVSPNFGSSE